MFGLTHSEYARANASQCIFFIVSVDPAWPRPDIGAAEVVSAGDAHLGREVKRRPYSFFSTQLQISFPLCRFFYSGPWYKLDWYKEKKLTTLASFNSSFFTIPFLWWIKITWIHSL